MIKDAIIAALIAALIQPNWLTQTLWEAAVTYGLTFWGLFVIIVDAEDWITERRRERWKSSK